MPINAITAAPAAVAEGVNATATDVVQELTKATNTLGELVRVVTLISRRDSIVQTGNTENESALATGKQPAGDAQPSGEVFGGTQDDLRT